MAQIKGLDNGYLYTKDNEKRIFRSAFKRTNISMGSSPFITINGIDYSIGVGDRNIDVDKSDSEMNIVTTLTDIAMTGDDDYYLVVGLPVAQYASQKDKFKKMVMGYNSSEVIFNGKKVKFSIKDVLVLPQSVGALLSLSPNEIKNKNIMLDFGGLTIDAVAIDLLCGKPQLKKSFTWNDGLQKIYPELANRICQECKYTNIDPADIDDKLINGIHTKGMNIPTDFLQPILREYLKPIMTNMQAQFNDINTQVFLCGGSAIVFKDIVKEYYPEAILIKDSQFANALGYYKVGLQVFGSLIQPKPEPLCYCNMRRA